MNKNKISKLVPKTNKSHSKNIIILRGLGGNFKSSIAKIFADHRYIMVPEANREFERVLSKFDRISDTELNYCAKYVVMQGFVNNAFKNPSLTNFVADRGLVDYGLMNEFVNTILLHYHDSYSKNLKVEELFKEECALLNGFKITNILLTTTDKKFLHKIIDESIDARACFFDNTEDYLKCQEMYREFILSHYNDVKEIVIDKVPDTSKYSDEMKMFVMKLFEQIQVYHDEY